MNWTRSTGCNGTTLHQLVDGNYLLASVAKDAGAWRVWLPGERRFLSAAGHDSWRNAKAAAEDYFGPMPFASSSLLLRK